jgi:hypothetical protein
MYYVSDIIEISSKDNFNFGTSLLGAAGMQGDGEFGSMFGFNGGEGASSISWSGLVITNQKKSCSILLFLMKFLI